MSVLIWGFAGVVLLAICACILVAFAVAAPWSPMFDLLSPKFEFWGEFMPG